ncbi:MAG: hypothetical protein ACOYMG_21085, partial [Candidatus Methylumidiphilus sp.]
PKRPARGVLPLAVWLDGDQSHGQAGTSNKASTTGRASRSGAGILINQGPSDRREESCPWRSGWMVIVATGKPIAPRGKASRSGAGLPDLAVNRAQ